LYGIKLVFVLDVLLNLFWSLDCKLVRYCNTEPAAQNNPWLLVEFVPPKRHKVRKFGKNITNFRRILESKIILQVLRACLWRGPLGRTSGTATVIFRCPFTRCAWCFGLMGTWSWRRADSTVNFLVRPPPCFVLALCSPLFLARKKYRFSWVGLLPREGLVELLLWSSGVPSPDARDAVG
jgi:hypothetical protein